MSAKNPTRLYVAEKDSPRLWLAPSKYTQGLFKSTSAHEELQQQASTFITVAEARKSLGLPVQVAGPLLYVKR